MTSADPKLVKDACLVSEGYYAIFLTEFTPEKFPAE